MYSGGAETLTVTIDAQARPDTPAVRSALVNTPALILPAVSVTYLLLVLCMWMPFGPSNGMGYETGFLYESQTSTWWDAFFYVDPLRPFTNVFYQLAYLLGSALTYPGDYLMYQLVFAVLWWGRGLLAFLLVRRLLGGYETFAYFVGAVVIVHASDGALNWVGQLNQYGFIFWMLLSFLCLLSAFDASRAGTRIVQTGLACLFAYLSLWSYESQILLISIFPLTLLAFRFGLTRSRLAVCAAYWTVPGVYATLNYIRYSTETATYQQGVMRGDFSLWALSSDLLFNVQASLEFWTWPRPTPPEVVVPVAIVAAAVAFVVAGYVVVRRLERSAEAEGRIGMPPAGRLAVVLGAGLLLLTLSFPVYLLLNSSRVLWRTQFLSGVGAALVVCASAALASAWPRRTRLGEIVPLLVVASVAGFGVWSGYESGWFHHRDWERHRVALEQILRVAPAVRPDTLIVLVDVPESIDPFGDNMWFDMGVRIAYPGNSVGGLYFRDNGTRPPGNGLELIEDRWKWNGTGYPPISETFPFANTIFVRYDARGNGVLLDEVPPFLPTSPAVEALYAPRALLTGQQPDSSAVQRFVRTRGSGSAVNDGR